jgi:hypothetical protein
MQAGRTCSSDKACRPGTGVPRARAGRLVAFAAGVLLSAFVSLPISVAAAPASQDAPPAGFTRADFGGESPSRETRYVADWVVHSNDHKGLPFAIVDKHQAKAYVFYPNGKLRGAAPVLLGIAKGDDSAPGIGERELSDIPVELRTTPAGRFQASIGRNASGKDVLWVDYDAAISMHRVIDTNPKERRPQRLATPTPLDNRISYGCINAPIKFFEEVVVPAFSSDTHGIVYVLPEVRPLNKVFAAYDVGEAIMRTAEAARSAPTSLASHSASSRPGVTAGQ